jgi:hypothetical protein
MNILDITITKKNQCTFLYYTMVYNVALFVISMIGLINSFFQFNFRFHNYVDDTQTYVNMRINPLLIMSIIGYMSSRILYSMCKK